MHDRHMRTSMPSLAMSATDNTSARAKGRHPDLKTLQASRPRPSSSSPAFAYTQPPAPGWAFGDGPGSSTGTSSEAKTGADGEETAAPGRTHVSIDPHAPNRAPSQNYRLLISAVTPRPIALLSTLSDEARPNLAPFSYFNLMSHDPPIFVIGFSSPVSRPKDSLRNLLATRQAVINMVSETYVEAANATSMDCPPGASEWDVAGLTPVYDCEVVRAPRAREAVFSVEVVLESVREWESRASGEKTGVMAVLEGVRFWARGDGLVGGEEGGVIDPAVLRPVGRLGGITYSRTTEGFELARPKFEDHLGGRAGLEAVKGRRG